VTNTNQNNILCKAFIQGSKQSKKEIAFGSGTKGESSKTSCTSERIEHSKILKT